MKRLRNLAFLAMVSLTVVPPTQAQVVSLRNGEYWIDQQFDQRKSVSITNGWQAELDASALGEGVHTICFRASDTRGRWSSPITRYFLRTVPTREGNHPATYQYWTDGDFDKRTTGQLSEGCTDLQVEYSSLKPGMHVFHIRVGDSYGQWSAPHTRYFLIPAPIFADNALAGYRYWIDGAYDQSVSGVMGETGTIDLQLDLSSLCKGLHTLSYQVNDKYGKASAPVIRYFVVMDSMPANNKITAYEYWFNTGPRARVEVEPENPLVLNDLVIEIKDVVPNEIPADYRFDTATETVYCDDDVFFGIAACDLAGHSSEAALSDTFRMTVPVRPVFVDLTEGETVTFRTPDAGHIRGFRMNATPGDSLAWTVSAECRTEFYGSDGTRVKAESATDDNGKMIYTLQAVTGTTYALLHHAPAVVQEMDITCSKLQATAITETSDGYTFCISKNSLTVHTPDSGRLKVFSMAGLTIVDADIPAGTSRLSLPTGVYLLQWENRTVHKIFVP